MGNEGAAGALVASVVRALRQVPGLSQVSDGAPIQAGEASATVEIGPETDWGHKSGEGAEVRFALLIRCGGERPGRVRQLMEMARQAVVAIGPDCGEWRLVSLVMLRSRTMPFGSAQDRRGSWPSWTGVAEYRARLLKGG